MVLNARRDLVMSEGFLPWQGLHAVGQRAV